VLRYLARYTHRVAIANGRLLGLEEGRVRFRWRDSRHGNQIKEMSLDAVEFIRRFLLHVLPGGFVKIRHFGFLSPTAIAPPWWSIAVNCCRLRQSYQPWSAPKNTYARSARSATCISSPLPALLCWRVLLHHGRCH